MTDRRREATGITDHTIPGTWSTVDNGPAATGKEDDDQRIYMDVCDRLMQFSLGDCTKVDVRVRAGIVTLAGNLPGVDPQRLEKVVRSVVGVRGIKNTLQG